MVKTNELGRKILQELFTSQRGLTGFILLARVKVPVPTFMVELKKLIKQNLIIADEEKDLFSLSDVGMKYLMEKKNNRNNEKPWESFPAAFKGNQIKINTFYLPNIENLKHDII